jgi:hypothetical protein
MSTIPPADLERIDSPTSVIWGRHNLATPLKVAEMILTDLLELTQDERDVVRKTLDKMVRERAGDGEAALLTNPVNIGIGTK